MNAEINLLLGEIRKSSVHLDRLWDTIDYLGKKFQRLIKTSPEDISRFESFLILLKQEQ